MFDLSDDPPPCSGFSWLKGNSRLSPIPRGMSFGGKGEPGLPLAGVVFPLDSKAKPLQARSPPMSTASYCGFSGKPCVDRQTSGSTTRLPPPCQTQSGSSPSRQYRLTPTSRSMPQAQKQVAARSGPVSRIRETRPQGQAGVHNAAEPQPGGYSAATAPPLAQESPPGEDVSRHRVRSRARGTRPEGTGGQFADNNEPSPARESRRGRSGGQTVRRRPSVGVTGTFPRWRR